MKSDKVFRLEAALQVAIMLVDDEPDFQDIIAKRLKRMGIALIQADCCDTAMLQLESHAMGVVIMDVNMPGIDGIKCLRKVKKQQPDAEVIILTGHASVKTGIEGMQSGAFDYCLKPIDVLELLEKVELDAQKYLINKAQ